MSLPTALRRRVAGTVAIVLAGSALAFLPAAVSSATTTLTPSAQIMYDLNRDRGSLGAEVHFVTNGYIDDYSLGAATAYANCSGCLNPINLVTMNITDTPTDFTTFYVTAAGGTTDNRVTRIVNDIETNDHANAFGDDFYGSVGVVTKGTTTYAVFMTASYGTVELDETRPGKVTLPSTIHVGVPVVPTITPFTPAPATDYEYTWIDGLDHVGAASTYTPQPSDLGHQLQLIVAEQNEGYSYGGATSALSAKVLAGTPSGPSSVIVTGARNVGEMLTVSLSGYHPVTPTVQWYRNGVAIAGETGATYTQTSADRGKKISAKLIVSTPGYNARSWMSSMSIVTNYPLLTTSFPAITGTPTFGQTLTAVPGTWGPFSPKLTYQWRSDGSAIKGATHSTLVLGSAQLNTSISVTVTGSEAGYATTSVTSSGTTDVHMLNFSIANDPTISGVYTHGQTLTVHVAAWTPAATMYVYQWYLNGVPVSGAIHTTFKLPVDAFGKSVSVSVIGMRPNYQPELHLSFSTVVN